MNINARQRVAIAAMLIAAAAHYSHAEAKDAEQLPVERYALYIASNNGGPGRETLRYAETDARTLSRTMAEIGGIKPENSIILASPTTRDRIRNAAFSPTRVDGETSLMGEPARRDRPPSGLGHCGPTSGKAQARRGARNSSSTIPATLTRNPLSSAMSDIRTPT